MGLNIGFSILKSMSPTKTKVKSAGLKHFFKNSRARF